MTDQEWLDNFKVGLIIPQPTPYPSVNEYATGRLRQIQSEIDRLESEKRILLRRSEAR